MCAGYPMAEDLPPQGEEGCSLVRAVEGSVPLPELSFSFAFSLISPPPGFKTCTMTNAVEDGLFDAFSKWSPQQELRDTQVNPAVPSVHRGCRRSRDEPWLSNSGLGQGSVLVWPPIKSGWSCHFSLA